LPQIITPIITRVKALRGVKVVIGIVIVAAILQGRTTHRINLVTKGTVSVERILTKRVWQSFGIVISGEVPKMHFAVFES
jgi:hypothetical protein